MENSSKLKLEQYAMEHFGAEMDGLGFKTYKGYRWYKLIRDEALLSFGFIPNGLHNLFDMQIGIQPIWSIGVPPGAEYYRMDEPPFLLNVETIRQCMWHPKQNHYFALNYIDIYPNAENVVQATLDYIVQPILSRLTDIRTVCEEAIWLNFVDTRYMHGRKMPPTPINYGGFINAQKVGAILALCFFRMYGACFEVLPELNGRIVPDYYDALERHDFEWLDARLHQNYEGNLKAIKRRLKLEPDCKDTIWDRDLRHPIDIDAMLWKRFKESTEGNEEGDYTIYSI